MRQLWAIIDKQTNDMLGIVITARHRQEAIRVVEEGLARPDNIMRRYPEAFELRHIGNFEIDGDNHFLNLAYEKIQISELAKNAQENERLATAAALQEQAEQAAFEQWAAQQNNKLNTKPSFFEKLRGTK